MLRPSFSKLASLPRPVALHDPQVHRAQGATSRSYPDCPAFLFFYGVLTTHSWCFSFFYKKIGLKPLHYFFLKRYTYLWVLVYSYESYVVFFPRAHGRYVSWCIFVESQDHLFFPFQVTIRVTVDFTLGTTTFRTSRMVTGQVPFFPSPPALRKGFSFSPTVRRYPSLVWMKYTHESDTAVSVHVLLL